MSTARYLAVIVTMLFLLHACIILDSEAGSERSENAIEDVSIEPVRSKTRTEDDLEWERRIFPDQWSNTGVYYNRDSNIIFCANNDIMLQSGGVDFYPVCKMDLNLELWEVSEEINKPEERILTTSIVDGNLGIIYRYGGWVSGSAYENDLFSYNTNTGVWSNLVSGNLLPESRTNTGSVYSRNDRSVYFHMGYLASTIMGGFYKVSTVAPYSRTSLNDGTMDGMALRRSHGLCIDNDNGKIYSWGGYSNMYLRELWEYDIGSNSWSNLSVDENITQSSYDRIFFDPSDGSANIMPISGINSSIWKYHPQNGTWNEIVLSEIIPNDKSIYFDEVSRKLYIAGGGSGNSQIWIVDMNSFSIIGPIGNEGPRSSMGFSLAMERNGTIQSLFSATPGNIHPYDDENNTWREPISIENGSIISSRINSGMCYLPGHEEAWILGGSNGGVDLGSLFRVDLNEMKAEVIFDDSILGNFGGTTLVYNPNNGLVYGFGGYRILGTGNFEFFSSLFTIDPENFNINLIDQGQVHPSERWGTSLLLIEESNEIFLFGGGDNTTLLKDLWRFDIDQGSWSEIDCSGNLPSKIVNGNLFFDRGMNDLYLFGGSILNSPHISPNRGASMDKMFRMDMISNRWEIVKTDPLPVTHLKPSFIYREIDGELIIFSMRTRSIWGTIIPERAKIIDVELVEPTSGEIDAYSRYDTYDLKTSLFSPGIEGDLYSLSLMLPSTRGRVYLNYSFESDSFDESDPLGLVDPEDWQADWNGKFCNLYLGLNFDWNFSSPDDGNTIIIKLMRTDGIETTLYTTNVISVKNQLKLEWDGGLTTDRGPICSGDWVDGEENISISGLEIFYKGTLIAPKEGSIDLELVCNGEKIRSIDLPETYPFNVNFTTPIDVSTLLDYSIKFSGLPEEIMDSNMEFSLRIDDVAPSPPLTLISYPDEQNGTEGDYDNDETMYFKWIESYDVDSGISGHYWSLEDHGGTANGNWTTEFFTEVEFPGSGTYKFFVWPVDNVGNIGGSTNITIHIDDLPIEFRISPDMLISLPYDYVDLLVEMEDHGGSDIETHTAQYRYSNNGNKAISWIGADAWKDVIDVWSSDRKQKVSFVLHLEELSKEANNLVQFRARDGAGTLYTSDVLYPLVDENIKISMVRLEGPSNGMEFGYSDEIILNWSVESHYPERIRYDLYLSENEQLVTDHDAGVLFEANLRDPSLEPMGLHYGTYYWDVVPIFDEVHFGSCCNGPYSFIIIPEGGASLMMESNILDDRIGIEQDGSEGFISLDVYNPGPIDLDVEIDIQVPDGLIIIPGNKNPLSATTLSVGSTITFSYRISAPEDMAVGSYEMVFNISSSQGPSIEVTYVLEVHEKAVEPKEDDNIDSPFLIIGIVILLVIIVLSILFLIIRSRRKTVPEENLERDEIDEELEKISSDTNCGLEGEPIEGKIMGEDLIHEVPSRFEEAHAHDKDKHKSTYEDMYGKRQINDTDPDITTDDLKNFINGQVKELEGIEIPQKDDDLFDLVSHMEKTSNDIVSRGLPMESDELELIAVEDPYDHQGEDEEDIVK